MLRPGGRLPVFEPINRRQRDLNLNRDMLVGYDATGCEDLAARIQSVFDRANDASGSPLLSFDETDLLAAAEEAGFDDLVVELRLEVRTRPLLGPMDWDTFCAFRPNPHALTVGETLEAALDEDDGRRLRAHLQLLVGVVQWVVPVTGGTRYAPLAMSGLSIGCGPVSPDEQAVAAGRLGLVVSLT